MKVPMILGVVAIASLGAAAITNPSPASYEDFATRSLTQYLKDNVCSKARSFLGNGLQEQCVAALSDNQGQIRQLIASNTQRQNLGVLSIYRTDIATLPFLPTYHFETVGVFQSFFIQKAEQR